MQTLSNIIREGIFGDQPNEDELFEITLKRIFDDRMTWHVNGNLLSIQNVNYAAEDTMRELVKLCTHIKKSPEFDSHIIFEIDKVEGWENFPPYTYLNGNVIFAGESFRNIQLSLDRNCIAFENNANKCSTFKNVRVLLPRANNTALHLRQANPNHLDLSEIQARYKKLWITTSNNVYASGWKKFMDGIITHKENRGFCYSCDIDVSKQLGVCDDCQFIAIYTPSSIDCGCVFMCKDYMKGIWLERGFIKEFTEQYADIEVSEETVPRSKDGWYVFCTDSHKIFATF